MVGKFITHETNVLRKGWSPPCTGLLHQPKRPRRKNDTNV